MFKITHYIRKKETNSLLDCRDKVNDCNNPYHSGHPDHDPEKVRRDDEGHGNATDQYYQSYDVNFGSGTKTIVFFILPDEIAESGFKHPFM